MTMRTYNYIKGVVWALALLALSACSDNNGLIADSSSGVKMTFYPALSGKFGTRAIGDASGIDRLTVAVYEGAEAVEKVFSVSEDWNTVQTEGITLTLVEGRPYKLLFWADNSDNTAYALTEDGAVSVDYTDYAGGGFGKMEELDAFYGVSYISTGAANGGTRQIVLTRPFAQLNFADKGTEPMDGCQAAVTFHSIPTVFNPFTGEVSLTDAGNDGDEVTFLFDDFPEEPLVVDGTACRYMSSNYLFAPATGNVPVSVTFELWQGGDVVNRLEFNGDKAIPLEMNTKTNVIGMLLKNM